MCVVSAAPEWCGGETELCTCGGPGVGRPRFCPLPGSGVAPGRHHRHRTINTTCRSERRAT
jgi:hypothetical protein